MLDLSATLTEAVFVYLCICVVVFVYLHVRHLVTLFLRSSYHCLFKNIAHVRSICKFDPNCIRVFVYLCTWEHCFWGPRNISFSKIARIANAVHCHSWLSGNKDCHEFRFSIVRIVISVSIVTSLQDCLVSQLWAHIAAHNSNATHNCERTTLDS